ncbi:MAG: hypothetical protein HY859_10800 [Caulobacterales bacterium]|nr:hypothetical protein [Caulobacterales bacterium]
MRRWLAGLGLALLLAAGIWLRLTYVHYFPLVPDEIGGPPASPPVLAAFGDDPPVLTIADWQGRRAPLLRAAFAKNVYGPMPPPLPGRVEKRVSLHDNERLVEVEGEQLRQLTIGFGEAGERGQVNVVLAMPPQGTPVRALIVMQNFCGNDAAVNWRFKAVVSFAAPPKFCKGPMGFAAHIILGRYINGPPLRRLTGRGYAVAMVYAADLVPDDARTAPAGLRKLYGPDATPGGALAAWAWLYSELGEVLTREPQLAGTPVVAWGHSRNGKAALLAGAIYPNIAGVIAHQSGRGGAALTRGTVGETVAQITGEYPYWFTPKYATFAGREAAIPVDQHQLLALAAPKPVLLGSGDRDRWGDPSGSFRALQGAWPIYRLYGVPPLTQTKLAKPDLTGPLASFMRPGTHGVTTADWETFLAFLDIHFPPPKA